jgi:hypothetical protein
MTAHDSEPGKDVQRGGDVQNGELAGPGGSVVGPISHGIREAAAFGRTAAVAAWAFLSSRRWLLAPLLATCALLVVLSLGQPKRLLIPQEPDAPEEKFDEVKNLRIVAGSSGSWFRRGTSADANGEKANNQVPGLTLSAPANESDLPESARLSRRLDAVRSRQNKGAWLTGKIDTAHALARQSSNAPLRPPARVLPPKTADSSSNSLHSTPESVFR